MILNQSAHYALRAVLFLAQHNDGAAHNADAIAAAIGVPRNYLGKVLHALGRSHVLTSVRGPRGGFKLAAAPERIPLADVIAPFQALRTGQHVCLLGGRACDPAHPCSAHERWLAMAEPVTAFFRDTSVALLLAAQNENGGNGKYNLNLMETP